MPAATSRPCVRASVRNSRIDIAVHQLDRSGAALVAGLFTVGRDRRASSRDGCSSWLCQDSDDRVAVRPSGEADAARLRDELQVGDGQPTVRVAPLRRHDFVGLPAVDAGTPTQKRTTSAGHGEDDDTAQGHPVRQRRCHRKEAPTRCAGTTRPVPTAATTRPTRSEIGVRVPCRFRAARSNGADLHVSRRAAVGLYRRRSASLRT